MANILLTTIAGSLTGMALAALTQEALPLGMAVTAYMMGGLFGVLIASTIPMLRKIG